MKKDNNRSNALEVAKPYFEGESTHQELFVTSDGQVFTEEIFADSHSCRLKNNSVEKVSRDDVFGTAKQDDAEPSILDASVKALPEALEAITDIAELEALIEEENSKTSRKGAISAIEARIEAINAAEAAKDIHVDLGAPDASTSSATEESTAQAGDQNAKQ